MNLIKAERRKTARKTFFKTARPTFFFFFTSKSERIFYLFKKKRKKCQPQFIMRMKSNFYIAYGSGGGGHGSHNTFTTKGYTRLHKRAYSASTRTIAKLIFWNQ